MPENKTEYVDLMAKKKPSRAHRAVYGPVPGPQVVPMRAIPDRFNACKWPEAVISKHRVIFMAGAAAILAVVASGPHLSVASLLKTSLASLLGVSLHNMCLPQF